MVFRIIGFCIIGIMFLHGFLSLTVLYIIRPYKSELLEIMIHPHLKRKFLNYFRFKDLTAVSLWSLLLISNLFLLIADITTNAQLWRTITHAVLTFWSVVGLLYWIYQTKNDYPDKELLKYDLKRYFTYKDHWYYSNCEDV